MDYQYEKALITDMVMKNETKKEIEKLLNSIKEKLGITAFNIIQEEIQLINITINKMADYIYSLEQEIIRKNQIIKDKLELKNE